MTQCPDCKSNSVQSKGWRTKGVRRYLCNNCGRNFTVNTRTKKETGTTLTMTEGDIIEPLKKIQEEVDTMESESKEMSNGKTTIQIDADVKMWLESLKLISTESWNQVLHRIKNKGITRGWMG